MSEASYYVVYIVEDNYEPKWNEMYYFVNSLYIV